MSYFQVCFDWFCVYFHASPPLAPTSSNYNADTFLFCNFWILPRKLSVWAVWFIKVSKERNWAADLQLIDFIAVFFVGDLMWDQQKNVFLTKPTQILISILPMVYCIILCEPETSSSSQPNKRNWRKNWWSWQSVQPSLNIFCVSS